MVEMDDDKIKTFEGKRSEDRMSRRLQKSISVMVGPMVGHVKWSAELMAKTWEDSNVFFGLIQIAVVPSVVHRETFSFHQKKSKGQAKQTE